VEGAVSIEIWIAFAVTAAGVIALPGPTVMLIVGFAVSSGTRRAAAAVLGVACGDIVAITLSFAGVGALLATSAEAFAVLKWAGAAYLIGLGLAQWRRRSDALGVADPSSANVPTRRMIGRAFVVTLLNPKGLLFFTAFMPQFVNPAFQVVQQMTILGATYVGLALAILALYVGLSERLRCAMAQASARRLCNRLSGGLLIGAGILAATARRG
jgi:homoserine/homoserine lactone efflux protein